MKALAFPTLSLRALSGIYPLMALALAMLCWRFWVVTHNGAGLYVDEAQYWVWAQQLDWGYFSKPPGIALLIRGSTALFGDGFFGVKALAMLCYPLAGLLAWAIARRLYDDVVAGWSALVVMTLPIYAWLGLFASTDALLTLFWLAGLWFYLRAVEDDRWADWLMLGVCGGLGLQSKYTMAVFGLAAILYLYTYHRPRLVSTKPWLAFGLVLLMLAPNLMWNAQHGFPTLNHTAEITLHREAGNSLRALGEFLAAQCLSFGPLLGGIAMLGVLQLRQLAKASPDRLLLWFALPLWAVVSLQAIRGGANANWAAPAFAPAAIVLVAWLLARQRQNWLAAGVAINLLLSAVVYHAPGLMTMIDSQPQARYNPFVRAMGWEQLADQLKPLAESHPEAVLLADNRTLLAHMGYALRSLQPQLVSWNPKGEATDHFKLTTDLGKHIGGDALFIGEQAPEAAMSARFETQHKLATLKVGLDARTSRQLEVYLLHGFQGY